VIFPMGELITNELLIGDTYLQMTVISGQLRCWRRYNRSVGIVGECNNLVKLQKNCEMRNREINNGK